MTYNYQGNNALSTADIEHAFGEVKACPFCYAARPIMIMTCYPHMHCTHCNADGPRLEGRARDHHDPHVYALRMWNNRQPPMRPTYQREREGS